MHSLWWLQSIITKKQKYLVIQLACASSSNWSSMYSSRGCGCNNGIDVLIISFLGNDSNVHENMMLPKLDTFVLLTNEGPSFEKDEHWSKNKHGVDGMSKGSKNGVTSDHFRTLKPP